MSGLVAAEQWLLTWIDKSNWGEGGWHEEPDRVEWTDRATGLHCLARRHEPLGCWNGYVAVPPGHPWHGVGCEVPDVRVYGDLTYAGPGDRSESIPGYACNGHYLRPDPPEDDWWFGFDCGHGWDLMPMLAALRSLPADADEPFDLADRLSDGRTYKSLAFVRGQCEVLAMAVVVA